MPCKGLSLFIYATIYSHSDSLPHLEDRSKTLSPFFATPASTTIAGIVSSKGTLSSSDLCSSLSFYKKQLKKTHRISKEQDPVQASSPTSTQRRPIMSTDQPYLKHNFHVKILRNAKDFISGSCMMTRDCRVPTSRAPGDSQNCMQSHGVKASKCIFQSP